MIGKGKTIEILKKVLHFSHADQTEALLIVTNSQLTRFANSIIHQNVSEKNANLAIRAVIGKKVGSMKTNLLAEDSIRRATEKAQEIAKLQKENPHFISLPSPKPIKEVKTFVPATAENSPEERAEAIKIVIEEANKNGVSAAGAFSITTTEIGVANSLGVEAYNLSTLANLIVVMSSETGSGYAEATSRDVKEIEPAKLAQVAVEKCLRSQNPEDLEPGEYEVVLEELAVGELLRFLAHLGFSALAVQENRSFMCSKFGQKVMGENISIWDDGLDTKGLAMPFDFEGLPKQRVDLIENGVAKAVVYDSYTAGIEGKESTGHALPAPNPWGPLPWNLFMKPGDATKEEMIRKTKRGLLVTRFWYTNVVHPLQTILTGMTRDGTFLIEDGEIKRPVKNLRFTESILKAFSNVALISKETKLVEYSVVPALKINKFNFSSATQF